MRALTVLLLATVVTVALGSTPRPAANTAARNNSPTPKPPPRNGPTPTKSPVANPLPKPTAPAVANAPKATSPPVAKNPITALATTVKPPTPGNCFASLDAWRSDLAGRIKVAEDAVEQQAKSTQGLFGFIRRFGLRTTHRTLNGLGKRIESESKSAQSDQAKVQSLKRAEAQLNQLGRASFGRQGLWNRKDCCYQADKFKCGEKKPQTAATTRAIRLG